MAIEDILLLGNPILTTRSLTVSESECQDARQIGKDLSDTMSSFRASHGWGRAISAPQIGAQKRIIFLNVDEPRLVINPVISEASDEMMEIWDDCMSFPELLVKVHRHVSFTMTWRDENWKEHSERMDGLFSELLQHEIDHLDGVLAVSRAVDGDSFALQSQRHLIPGAVFANEVKRTD